MLNEPQTDNLQTLKDMGLLAVSVATMRGDMSKMEAELSGAMQILRAVVIGENGQNGLRGELREAMGRLANDMRTRDASFENRLLKYETTMEDLAKKSDLRFEKLDNIFQQHMAQLKTTMEKENSRIETLATDHKLPGNCLGRKALEDHEKNREDSDKRRREEMSAAVLEMKKVKASVRGNIIIAAITIGIPGIITMVTQIIGYISK